MNQLNERLSSPISDRTKKQGGQERVSSEIECSHYVAAELERHNETEFVAENNVLVIVLGLFMDWFRDFHSNRPEVESYSIFRKFAKF